MAEKTRNNLQCDVAHCEKTLTLETIAKENIKHQNESFFSM